MKKISLLLAVCMFSLASIVMAGQIDFNRVKYAAGQGNPEAMFEVGKALFSGTFEGANFTQDYEQAHSWLQKAAASAPGRFPEAEFLLGKSFDWGAGVEQNYDNAAYWYQNALNHGYQGAADALNHLRAMGHGGNNRGGGIGSGVTFDDDSASGGIGALVNNTGPVEPPFHHDPGVDRLMRAAQSGRADAQYQLGMAYLNGEHGLPSDATQAFHWVHESAERSYGQAERQLSEMYMRGIGVRHSRHEALEWDRRARRQGF